MNKFYLFMQCSECKQAKTYRKYYHVECIVHHDIKCFNCTVTLSKKKQFKGVLVSFARFVS